MPQNDDLTRELLISREKIGKTRRELAEWALRICQKESNELTGPDWSNFALEISVFCSLVKNEVSLELRKEISTGANPRISIVEAKGILRIFKIAIENILNHENLPFGEIKKQINLLRNEKDGKYWLEPYSYSSWEEATKDSLSDLLIEFGHLIKRCQAPRPYGDGDLCGELFLARRTNQFYCSTNCQGRTTTRASRERSAQRKPKKKSAKKAGGKRGRKRGDS